MAQNTANLFLLFCILSPCVYAHTYPPCNSSEHASVWNSCIGESKILNGEYQGYIYKGQWRNGAADGFGEMISSEGTKSVGVFKNNQREGFFEIYYSDGTLRYKGTVSNGKLNGKGIYYFQDGSNYEGGFVNNLYSGKGKFMSKERTYDGEWANGERNGFGKEVTDKFTYTGYWKNNMFNGNGTLLYPDGDKYIGNFVNDKKEGNGTYYSPRQKNRKISGIWRSDELIEDSSSSSASNTINQSTSSENRLDILETSCGTKTDTKLTRQREKDSPEISLADGDHKFSFGLTGGSGTAGANLSDESLSKVLLGTTTIQEITSAFGKPTSQVKQGRYVILTYFQQRYDTSLSPAMFIPVIGSLIGTAKVETTTRNVTFIFNSSTGIVEGCKKVDQSSDQTPPSTLDTLKSLKIGVD